MGVGVGWPCNGEKMESRGHKEKTRARAACPPPTRAQGRLARRSARSTTPMERRLEALTSYAAIARVAAPAVLINGAPIRDK